MTCRGKRTRLDCISINILWFPGDGGEAWFMLLFGVHIFGAGVVFSVSGVE